MKNRILCVVVTYNRLECLKECLKALKLQTFEFFDICVVNNGSTDGTKDFLDGQKNLIVIHQDNLGSSGGQYAGEKYGYDNGYEWIWMMDDDGFPESHQLEELLKYGDKGNFFLNALVIDKEDHSKLSFSYRNNTLNDILKKDIIEGWIAPFNGTFVHRSAIDKVGFVKHEMFIWGDEQEYWKRMESHGYVPTTVVKAVHYHPSEKGVFKSVLPPFIRARILVKPKKMSKYYYRNCGYIDATYHQGNYLYILKQILYPFIYYIRTGDITESIKFVIYYFRGRNNNYDR